MWVISRNLLDHSVQKDIEALPRRGIAVPQFGAGFSGEAARCIGLAGGGERFETRQQYANQRRGIC
jgi:hypothetical protein